MKGGRGGDPRDGSAESGRNIVEPASVHLWLECLSHLFYFSLLGTIRPRPWYKLARQVMEEKVIGECPDEDIHRQKMRTWDHIQWAVFFPLQPIYIYISNRGVYIYINRGIYTIPTRGPLHSKPER